jgi:hypothetical protein
VDTAHVLVDPTMGRDALYVAATRGRSGNRLYVANDATLDPDLDRAPDAPGTALEVLAGVLGRESGDRSARDTMEEEFAAADSLARLVPEYEHARGLLAAQRGEVDAVLRQALPARQVADVRAERAWPTLAARIVHLVDTTPDPVTALQAAVQAGPLDDADSVAKVLAHRLDLTHGAPPALQPAGTAAAPGAGEDRGVEGWLAARRNRIQGRIDTLTDDAVTTQPQWLVDHIGPRPVAAAADDIYLAAVRAVAAYRDRYTITSTRTALGPEPANDGPQLRAWRAATDRVEDYRAHTTRAGPGPGDAGPSLREQVAARAQQARQDAASAAVPRRTTPRRAASRAAPSTRTARPRAPWAAAVTSQDARSRCVPRRGTGGGVAHHSGVPTPRPVPTECPSALVVVRAVVGSGYTPAATDRGHEVPFISDHSSAAGQALLKEIEMPRATSCLVVLGRPSASSWALTCSTKFVNVGVAPGKLSSPVDRVDAQVGSKTPQAVTYWSALSNTPPLMCTWRWVRRRHAANQ